jgi:hypothetical protein
MIEGVPLMKIIRAALFAAIALGIAPGHASAAGMVVRPSHALNPQPEVPSKPHPHQKKKPKPVY